MNKTLFSTLAAIAAFAAAPAQADTSWTGPYVGAHIGYDQVQHNSRTTLGSGFNLIGGPFPGPATITQNTKQPKAHNLTFGAQIGYNHELGSNVVVGAELEASYVEAKKSKTAGDAASAAPFLFISNKSAKVHHQITAKAKLGYAINTTLLYATAGATLVSANYASDFTLTPSPGVSLLNNKRDVKNTKLGVLFGAGLEQKLSNRISLRMEYNHATIGKVSGTDVTAINNLFFGLPNTNSYHTDKLKLDTVKLGLNIGF